MMREFQHYRPYIVNLDMLAQKTLTLVDEKNTEIFQKPFFHMVQEVVSCAEPCVVNTENMGIALGYLQIYFKGQVMRIKGDRFFLDIFKLIADTRNIHGHDFGWPWLWLFIGGDYVRDDAMCQYYHFMICNNGKIMREFVNIYDIPEDFFQEDTEYFFSDDDKIQQAKIRMYYESFYKETLYGKNIISQLKNERDIALFGQIRPCMEEIDVYTLVQLPDKIDRLIGELKSFKRLFVGFIIGLTILIMWMKLK